MQRKIFFLLLFLYLTAFSISRQITYEDKIRIREAVDIRDKFGEQIWKGITREPFILLLVTDSVEYLINHPDVPNDFIDIGYDTILRTQIYKRDRVFDIDLLATFPAVNGVNTIVVGTPENTGKSSMEWIVTLLHEHFHQYTFNSKDYNIELEKLGLRGEDAAGMWMLNYPFPYNDGKVIDLYNELSAALLYILETDEKPDLRSLKIIRDSLMKTIGDKNYSYMSFQEWQEGIARFTEYKFLELLDNYESYPGITSLPDHVTYDLLKHKAMSRLLGNLREPKLRDWGRTMFYYSGMAEGILLDRIDINWRDKYLTFKFFLEKYY